MIALGFLLINCSSRSKTENMKSLIPNIDHLVYAAPNLQTGIDEIESLLGIHASMGGSHPGRGTRNALIALGEQCYLEIIAPDPVQVDFHGERVFGIDDLSTPKIVTWAVKSNDLTQLTDIDLGEGIKLGEIIHLSRLTAEGDTLAWQLTDPSQLIGEGTIPFFINWGQMPHPSKMATPGATIVDLRIEHPNPDIIQNVLVQLGLNVSVSIGKKAAIVATIDCPKGKMELR